MSMKRPAIFYPGTPRSIETKRNEMILTAGIMFHWLRVRAIEEGGGGGGVDKLETCALVLSNIINARGNNCYEREREREEVIKVSKFIGRRITRLDETAGN